MSVEVPRELRDARKEAFVSRQVIEGLLLALPELPRSVDRGPIAQALSSMLTSLAEWAETDVDHPEIHARLEGVIAALTSAVTLLREVEGSPSAMRGVRSLAAVETALVRCKELTIDAIVAAQDRLLRAPAPIEAPLERPFRASVGIPVLQRLARAAIDPVVAVEAPARDEDDNEDEDDEDEDALIARPEASMIAPDRRGDPGEIAQIRRLARDCIEDLGVFENLRRRNEDEAWPAVAPFEQRLLDNADALLSLEMVEPGAARVPGVIAQALSEAANTSFPDPGRAFAATFTLGCIEGEDVVDAMLLALRQADPETLEAQESALVLAPSPGVAKGARRLLRQGDPRLIRLALSVLRERREAIFADTAVLVSHADTEVASAAAKTLGVVPERIAALEALDALAIDDPDETMAPSIVESFLLQGSPRGLEIARQFMREELGMPPSAASESLPSLRRLLGIAGDAADAELLLAAFAHSPSDPMPLGWLGHVSAVAPLALALGEEAAQRGEVSVLSERENALIEALHRITGASVLTPPLLGAPASPFDSAAFAAWWSENEKRFSPRTRYRFGNPYSPLQSLSELESDSASKSAREAAAIEIAIAMSGTILFRCDDWVARQRAEIEVLRARLADPQLKAPVAGEFLGHWLGRPR